MTNELVKKLEDLKQGLKTKMEILGFVDNVYDFDNWPKDCQNKE